MITAIMICMFAAITLSMVGLCGFVYSGRDKFHEGMILGIHIPEDQKDHSDVLILTGKYRRTLRRFQWINLAVGMIISFLPIFTMGISTLLWVLWALEYCCIFSLIRILAQRKMYALKVRHQWFMPQTHATIAIDTRVSAMSAHFPISWKWHLIPFAVGLLFWCIPAARRSFLSVSGAWSFPAIAVFIPLFFLVLHQCLTSRKNTVYSKDSQVNEKINRLEKRTWSIVIIAADYASFSASLYISLRFFAARSLHLWDYIIYAAVDFLGAAAIIAGVLIIVQQRRIFLDADQAPLISDDDEYWKNGWYSNPDDRHLWVQDRLCSTNYTLNMAHPGAKWFLSITGIFVVAAVAVCVGVAGILHQLDTASVSMAIDQDTVTISYAFYDCSFGAEDILGLRQLDALPDDDFRRTNGGDTDRLLVGFFRNGQDEDVMMFMYKKESPVIEIDLTDQTVFLNSDVEGQTQSWYHQLSQLTQ